MPKIGLHRRWIPGLLSSSKVQCIGTRIAPHPRNALKIEFQIGIRFSICNMQLTETVLCQVDANAKKFETDASMDGSNLQVIRPSILFQKR